MILKTLAIVAIIGSSHIVPFATDDDSTQPECINEAGEGHREVTEAREDGQNGELYNNQPYAKNWWTAYGSLIAVIDGGEDWVEELADLPRESGIPDGGDCRYAGRHEGAEEISYEFKHEFWPDHYPRPR